MRFIYDTLGSEAHLHPWGQHRTIIKIGFFFWSPGTSLQKSFNGLLRSLLQQLLTPIPHLISKLLPSIVRERTAATTTNATQWLSSDLVSAILTVVRARTFHLFFLIDGLDELQGSDQEKDDLLDLFHNLSGFDNVKLCVASRAWNVFQDAFAESPKLKLEDYTARDIHAFVNGALNSQRCFQQLKQMNPESAAEFIRTILGRASGVFLWVYL